MKARTVPFSSLMFLKATPKELVRKRRLRDKLLMALRASLIALLALVFARPFIPAEKIPLVPSRDSESVVVLIDRSFSMQYGDTFSRAAEAARDRLDRAATGDEIAVVAFDDQVQVLAGFEAEPAVKNAAMNGLEPAYRPTDFFPALQRAEELLQDARHDRRVVVLISDFQDGGWSGPLEDWKLQEGIVFEPIGVGSDAYENAYVEAFELSKTSAGGQGLARFDARVADAGAPGAGERAVVLSLDGSEVERQVLPSGRTTVSFQQIYSREGTYQGMISLPADDLPADNRYFFTDHFGGRPEILVVDENGGSSSSDALFIRHAFDLGEASRFGVSSAPRIQSADLNRFDVVFLSHPRELSNEQLGTLRRYAENGGAIVVSPGAAADAASLSETLGTLGIGRVDRLVDARSELGFEVIIGEVDLRHPIFEPFAGAGSGAILRPRFRRYARFTPADEARVIGRFDSGDPFLVERELGSGRVLFYASTFGTTWTDMPLDEMFVPFLYELAEFGTSGSDVRQNLTVGEPMPLSGRPAESVEVRTPDGRVYSVDLDDQGRGFFRRTDLPGHYRASTTSGPQQFSVNVDRRESELRFRSTEEVYAAVTPPPSDAPVTPAEAAAAIEDDERSQKLWRWLLLFVIALFGLETYMANRSRASDGRRRRRPGDDGKRRREPIRSLGQSAGTNRNGGILARRKESEEG